MAHSQQPLRPFPSPESLLHKIIDERYVTIKILSTSSNSAVYLAKDVTIAKLYAIKALPQFDSNGSPISRDRRAMQERECTIHTQAYADPPTPPKVVPLHRYYQTDDHIFLVMDYYPRGHLFSNLDRLEVDYDIRTAFLQILDAVQHCHGRGIYHRDLKPENIFVTGSDTDTDTDTVPATLLLGDFGHATRLESDAGSGTPGYTSPECLAGGILSTLPSVGCRTSEIWSLGVILIELTCTRLPWDKAWDSDERYYAFLGNRRSFLVNLDISDELVDIVFRRL